MAEILIRAKPHWMDDFTQKQINALTDEQKISREARIQIGDIVVVRPDGWVWGAEECLPTFIVVKLPGVSVETVKLWEEALYDMTDPEKPVMLKARKYKIPTPYMNQVLGAGESVVTVNLGPQQIAFLENIETKAS